MHRWLSPGNFGRLSLLHLQTFEALTISAFPKRHINSFQTRKSNFENRSETIKITKFDRWISIGTYNQKHLDPNAEEQDWIPMAKGDKVVKVRLSTTRLDTIIKAGLQISKNKIMKAFYDDRIRINGERPRKKSQQLAEGDEVDVIRGQNKVNPEFLDVARVEIVTVNEDGIGHSNEEDYASDDEGSSDAKIPVVLKRYKSLTIENYSEAWKGGVEES